jgi:hypothetical protein
MHLISSKHDEVTGFTDELWFDDATGKMTIRRLQDVEGVLKSNVAQYNNHTSINYSDSCGVHKVATIPLVVIEKWMKEGFNWYRSTDAERRRKLNDPDNRKFLVRPGKL